MARLPGVTKVRKTHRNKRQLSVRDHEYTNDRTLGEEQNCVREEKVALEQLKRSIVVVCERRSFEASLSIVQQKKTINCKSGLIWQRAAYHWLRYVDRIIYSDVTPSITQILTTFENHRLYLLIPIHNLTGSRQTVWDKTVSTRILMYFLNTLTKKIDREKKGINYLVTSNLFWLSTLLW